MTTLVYIGTSLDGFIARKNGDIAWLEQFANEEAIQSYNQFIDRVDAIVIGRGTFEKVLSFSSWPYTKMVYVLSASITELPGDLKEKAMLLSMTPKDLLHFLSKKGLSTLYID